MLQGWIQIGLTLILIVAITPILVGYIARVYLGQKTWLDRVLTPVEQTMFRLSGVQPQAMMNGWQYARAILYSNLAMATLLFLMLMFQGILPLNPTGLGAPLGILHYIRRLHLSQIPTSSTTLVKQLSVISRKCWDWGLCCSLRRRLELRWQLLLFAV